MDFSTISSTSSISCRISAIFSLIMSSSCVRSSMTPSCGCTFRAASSRRATASFSCSCKNSNISFFSVSFSAYWASSVSISLNLVLFALIVSSNPLALVSNFSTRSLAFSTSVKVTFNFCLLSCSRSSDSFAICVASDTSCSNCIKRSSLSRSSPSSCLQALSCSIESA